MIYEKTDPLTVTTTPEVKSVTIDMTPEVLIPIILTKEQWETQWLAACEKEPNNRQKNRRMMRAWEKHISNKD